MKGITIISILVCTFALHNSKVTTTNLSGPMVYVVTPSTESSQNEEARSAPFYYHNWKRRMDLGPNTTTSVPMTTTLKKKETPDLIFAEFESESNEGMKKSIRKLLEKERVDVKTSSTFSPVYVPDEEIKPVTQKSNYGLPLTNEKPSHLDKKTNYFEMYNQLYSNAPAPIYTPTIKSSTTTTKFPTTTSSESQLSNVENIWHIIDSEKSSHFSNNWEEVSIGENHEVIDSGSKLNIGDKNTAASDNDDEKLYNKFEGSGFGTNPGNDAENESRAIRTETNMRFPYVNLKPFQVKSIQKPVQNNLLNSKKNNLYTNLDNFYDLKKPVRGEAQDIIVNHQPIDRYNPAQPYLPQSYGGNSQQINSVPVKATSNLVPPPPPPPPKLTDNDFPAPTNYDSFPPYPPSVSDTALPSLPISKPSISVYSRPAPQSLPNSPSPQVDNSGPGLNYVNQNNNAPLMSLGYHYKPPSSSIQSFEPTLPPVNVPFKGYTYTKSTKASEVPESPSEDNTAFQGYHYDKPSSLSPSSDDLPSLSYSHHDSSNHDSDYKDLIFQNDHEDDSKDSDPNSGIDMMLPPPPDMKPESHGSHMDDSGFPSDFPEDFKYHYDFDDHDYSHHHHHHTTTTTTTEMPRVNRFSYYYLGKKLYYLPLYFSVYFIVYVGALIIKAVLRHKIVYPNSWRPNGTTAGFFSKRSIESWDLSNENLHEVTGRVTHAIATAAKMYLNNKEKNK